MCLAGPMNEQQMLENLYQMPLSGARIFNGYGRNIDAEIKNIFSPIRASHSSFSNASSASYGTPEHISRSEKGYYDSKQISSDEYYHPRQHGGYSKSSEMLMARPNSSGPSVFMREFGRDHR